MVVKEERRKPKSKWKNNVDMRNAEFLTHATTWMNLEDTMQKEISQS